MTDQAKAFLEAWEYFDGLVEAYAKRYKCPTHATWQSYLTGNESEIRQRILDALQILPDPVPVIEALEAKNNRLDQLLADKYEQEASYQQQLTRANEALKVAEERLQEFEMAASSTWTLRYIASKARKTLARIKEIRGGEWLARD